MSTLLQCTSCDSSFNSNLLLEMHRRFCFPIPSQISTNSINGRENFQTHFSHVSQESNENSLICHVCNACYELFDIEKYIFHINNDHNNENDYDNKENEVSDLYSEKDNKMDVDQDFNSQFNDNIQFNQYNHYNHYNQHSQSEDSVESNRQNLIVNENHNFHIENNDYSENEDEDEDYDEGEVNQVNEAYEVNLALLSSYLIHEKYEKQGKENDQTQICHICYEKIKLGEEIIRLPCFHYYHSNELMTWFKENVKCPECRLDVIDEIRKTAIN